MEWVMGHNPFSQSTMYGLGYDFPPIYTPSSGDIVGGLPVGIQTRGDSDIPYWPVQNTWTYKEIWIHPVNQWMGLMREITSLSDRFAEDKKTENNFSIEASGRTTSKGDVTITLKLNGTGSHSFKLRTCNLSVKGTGKNVTLETGREVVLKWQAGTINSDEPWVAVIVGDNNISNRYEVSGAVWNK
jgi:hypothetical protein